MTQTWLVVVDPQQWRYFSDPLRAFLVASWRELDASLGGNLLIAHGDPAQILPQVAVAAGAKHVHAAAAHTPAGDGVWLNQWRVWRCPRGVGG